MNTSSVCLPCFPVIAAVPDQKISWMEIALLAGAIGLATVALLTQFDWITIPAGVLTSSTLAYTLYGGAGILLLIETAIQICKCHRQKQVRKFRDSLTFTTKPLTPEEIASRTPLYNYHLNDFGTDWAVLSGKKKEATSTACVLRREVTIGEIKGTLFGIYQDGSHEEELVSLLNNTDHKDVKITLDLIQQFCTERGANVGIQCTNILYLAGKHFLYTQGTQLLKSTDEAFHLIPQAEQKQLAILLSAEAFSALQQEQYAPLLNDSIMSPKDLSDKLKMFFSLKQTENISLVLLFI